MIADVTSAAGAAAQPTTAARGMGGALGKEEFLKMLVAQLQNQDPMNPMNGDDMAAQLAQFSSLEQLTNISTQLDAQAVLQRDIVGSINDTTALTTIGQTVLAVGDQVEVGSDATVRFEVGGEGGNATLKIIDDTGKEVGSRSLGFVGGGRHGEAADGVAPGTYHYAVEVVDAAGDAVPVEPFIHARVDGVRYGPQGPVLTAGGIRISFGTILQIGIDG